jgi:hypothetical protein
MPHPIHLHGHYFRVLGSKANSVFPSNMTVGEVNDQMRDSDIAAALNLSNTAPQEIRHIFPKTDGWLSGLPPITLVCGCCIVISIHTSP